LVDKQEFERLGSTKTIKVNVRLVAATNRDLARMVDERQFRSDLYYRLNVFPLTVPALRDRREDVPLLVRHFAQKFAQRMNRTIDSISNEQMTTLSQYDWPGNVRELENLIERAVILSQGSELRVPLEKLQPANPSQASGSLPTLEAAERDHIVRALQASNWVIGGSSGGRQTRHEAHNSPIKDSKARHFTPLLARIGSEKRMADSRWRMAPK